MRLQHRRDLFSTLNDYPNVATLLHDFARRRLEERALAEKEKLKTDAIRNRMSEMGMCSNSGSGSSSHGGRLSVFSMRRKESSVGTDDEVGRQSRIGSLITRPVRNLLGAGGNDGDASPPSQRRCSVLRPSIISHITNRRPSSASVHPEGMEDADESPGSSFKKGSNTDGSPSSFKKGTGTRAARPRRSHSNQQSPSRASRGENTPDAAGGAPAGAPAADGVEAATSPFGSKAHVRGGRRSNRNSFKSSADRDHRSEVDLTGALDNLTRHLERAGSFVSCADEDQLPERLNQAARLAAQETDMPSQSSSCCSSREPTFTNDASACENTSTHGDQPQVSAPTVSVLAAANAVSTPWGVGGSSVIVEGEHESRRWSAIDSTTCEDACTGTGAPNDNTPASHPPPPRPRRASFCDGSVPGERNLGGLLHSPMGGDDEEEQMESEYAGGSPVAIFGPGGLREQLENRPGVGSRPRRASFCSSTGTRSRRCSMRSTETDTETARTTVRRASVDLTDAVANGKAPTQAGFTRSRRNSACGTSGGAPLVGSRRRGSFVEGTKKVDLAPSATLSPETQRYSGARRGSMQSHAAVQSNADAAIFSVRDSTHDKESGRRSRRNSQLGLQLLSPMTETDASTRDRNRRTTNEPLEPPGGSMEALFPWQQGCIELRGTDHVTSGLFALPGEGDDTMGSLAFEMGQYEALKITFDPMTGERQVSETSVMPDQPFVILDRQERMSSSGSAERGEGGGEEAAGDTQIPCDSVGPASGTGTAAETAEVAPAGPETGVHAEGHFSEASPVPSAVTPPASPPSPVNEESSESSFKIPPSSSAALASGSGGTRMRVAPDGAGPSLSPEVLAPALSIPSPGSSPTTKSPGSTRSQSIVGVGAAPPDPKVFQRKKSRAHRSGSVTGLIQPACVACGTVSGPGVEDRGSASPGYTRAMDGRRASTLDGGRKVSIAGGPLGAAVRKDSLRDGGMGRRASLHNNSRGARPSIGGAPGGDSDITDKGGVDAATFINTRPWVRSREAGGRDESHPDAENAHFWDPDKAAAAAFDTFGAVLNYIHMMILPIICFVFGDLPANLLYGMIAFDAWMAVDMTMHLRGMRPYYDKKEGLIIERKRILRHYLRTRFPIDLLSSLPYELIPLALSATASVSPYWRFRCVVRFYRVRRVLHRLEDSFELQGYVAITRLILGIIIVVHWITCMWLSFGMMPSGWAFRADEINNNVHAQTCAMDRFSGCSGLYVKSLYWTFSTLMTVGYGDIFPTTNEEIVFAALVCFIFHASYSFMLGLITNYVFSLNRTAALFRDKIAQLNAFMEYRQLSPSVRARISELYSGRLWQSTGGLDEQAILSSLPASIRRNVSLLMYAELLLNVPLFTDAEFGFIQSLADKLRPHVYPPNELVVLMGEIGREMFFCARGECEVLGENEQRVFTITDGMFFGEVAVLFSVKCTATVRTVTYCDLLSLAKEALGDAMRDYPKAAQIIAMRAKVRMAQLGINSAMLHEAVSGAGTEVLPNFGGSSRFTSRTSSAVEERYGNLAPSLYERASGAPTPCASNRASYNMDSPAARSKAAGKLPLPLHVDDADETEEVSTHLPEDEDAGD